MTVVNSCYNEFNVVLFGCYNFHSIFIWDRVQVLLHVYKIELCPITLSFLAEKLVASY